MSRYNYAKLILANVTLTLLLCIVSLEIFLRAGTRDKGTSWIGTDYYATIEKGSKAASSTNDLVLVVGDSFAAHQKGAGGNMFDLAYDCKSKENCIYYNIAIPGTDTQTYWNSIQYVLKDRPQQAPTHIVMVLYYGNDFHISDKSRADCGEIFNAKNPSTRRSFIEEVKSRSLSAAYIYRLLKSSFSFGINNTKNLHTRAERLQGSVSAWKGNYFAETLSRVPEQIKLKIKNDVLNPWEVALAMANPYYYQELYNMSEEWSDNAILCTTKSIGVNLSNLEKRFPNLTFTLLGLPDKFYWNSSTSESTLQEYRDLGYIMEVPSRSVNARIPRYLSQFSKSNGISFLHLPQILNGDNTDISNYFYQHDMHLNRFGNIELAAALKRYLDNNLE